ncbi:GntR family transcriptional regulator [Pseudochelatococcus sp. B33]
MPRTRAEGDAMGRTANSVQEDELRVLEPIKLKSLREHVHDELRQAIISGRLKLGSRLNERKLAADLGTSTSPLKEALRQLESEGLVRTEARRGTFVTFSPRQAEEMTLARAALESIIARQAAKHGGEEAFDRLRALIEEMRAAVESGQVHVLIELNEAFHDTIHDASGCEYLRRLQSSQRMYDHAARVAVLARPHVQRTSFHEHEAIMRAITARDEDLAERLMREHIVKAGTTHIKLVF